MVCLLMRKKRKVVFLPDCKQLLREPVDYFRSALLLTFAAEPAAQAQVAGLCTVDAVIGFCKAHNDLTFIVDQYNALEQDMKKDDADTLQAKSVARRLIDSASYDRALLKAASANNFTARVIHDKQLNMNIVTLFGGLTPVNHATICARHTASGCMLSAYSLADSAVLCGCAVLSGGDSSVVPPFPLPRGCCGSLWCACGILFQCCCNFYIPSDGGRNCFIHRVVAGECSAAV